MAAHEYAFTLTPGNSSRTRSLAIAGAAIAAVCVLSSAVVMRELVGTPAVRAAAATVAIPATAAIPATPTLAAVRAWTLEPRWWPSEIKQILRPAATMPDSELTFAKGYQLRLAARQAARPAAQQPDQPASAPAQVATGPAAESQPGRLATVRKATSVAHTDMPPVRRVNATQVDPPADPFARFDTGTRALAYDEQRPSERGIAYRSAPPRGLFGTLY
jgi:hypothetical protein